MSDQAPEKQAFGYVPIAKDGSLTVGVVPVLGPGYRVAMLLDGNLALMSPAKARRMSKSFETGEAAAHDMTWIAEALREAADDCEAKCATKQ